MKTMLRALGLFLILLGSPASTQIGPLPGMGPIILNTGGGGLTQKTIKIATGTTSYTIPADYVSLVKVAGIGAGGGGADGAGGFSANGACSGAYSEQTSGTGLSAGITVGVNVPAGGAHANPGTLGGDVWFCKTDTTNCASIAGTNVIMGAKGGPGGTAHGSATCTAASSASGIGSTKYSGGVGGLDDTTSGYEGGSGAGAAGPNGAGQNAGNGALVHGASGGGGGTDGGTAGTNAVTITPGVGGNNFSSIKVGADGVYAATGNNGTAGGQFTLTAGGTVGPGGGCSAAGGATATTSGTSGIYGAGGCGGNNGNAGTSGTDALLLFIYMSNTP